jgi:hypothetical protein
MMLRRTVGGNDAVDRDVGRLRLAPIDTGGSRKQAGAPRWRSSTQSSCGVSRAGSCTMQFRT